MHAGQKVELQHFRYDESCQGYRELKPIESNPTYDFDYQQTNFLPEEITVLPVSKLALYIPAVWLNCIHLKLCQ